MTVKRRLARAFGWWCAIMATILLCHVSHRLREASTLSYCFNTDETDATFSELVLFAAYLYVPPSYDPCITKLRHIDTAKQEWALDTKAPLNAIPTWADIGPYLGIGHPPQLRCPLGGVYAIGCISNAPTCSVKGHSLP